MSPWIAISLGDVTGIGPEVTLKALEAELPRDDFRYLVLGDHARLCLLAKQLSIRAPFEPFSSFHSNSRIQVHAAGVALPAGLSQGAPEAARAVLAWLREGARLCLARETAALVTAPINKAAIIQSGVPFVGQTEFLSELAGASQTVMMLLGADEQGRWLRVALATTHVPIRKVADSLTAGKVALAVSRAAEACQLLGLKRARIGVCGLNPHAGEGGQMGTEEIALIKPALDSLRDKLPGEVLGPIPADTLFYYALRGEYDAVVAMYHDQGLAPLKMIAFESGVNWTLGLPFVRTSPDHGTAYDIAGKGVANPGSMISAIRLAKQLCQKR